MKITNKKELLACWKEYRGSNDGYLMTSLEAWQCIQTTIFDRHLPVYDRLIAAVHEDAYCQLHDC